MALLASIESTNFISAIPNPLHRMSFMLHHGTIILRHLISRLDVRSAELNFEHLLEDSGVILTATAAAVDAPAASSSPAAAAAVDDNQNTDTENTDTENTDTSKAAPSFNDTCARDLRAAHDVMRQALWTLEELEEPDATTVAAVGLDAAALDDTKVGVEEMAKLLFWAEEMVGMIEVKCQGLREQVFNAVEG
ncbi:hypothetical protein BKA80DRAFT_306657 [Phyllosticta citrichinensis]